MRVFTAKRWAKGRGGWIDARERCIYLRLFASSYRVGYSLLTSCIESRAREEISCSSSLARRKCRAPPTSSLYRPCLARSRSREIFTLAIGLKSSCTIARVLFSSILIVGTKIFGSFLRLQKIVRERERERRKFKVEIVTWFSPYCIRFDYSDLELIRFSKKKKKQPVRCVRRYFLSLSLSNSFRRDTQNAR